MKGSCLCRGVVVVTSDHDEINACHCSMCRRWTGGPFMAVHCGPDVVFSGEIAPATFESSTWAERGFCPKCGTSLFYHLLPAGDYILSAGLFEDAQQFRIASQIFIDEKPEYYALANDTPALTGKEVFAQYGSE